MDLVHLNAGASGRELFVRDEAERRAVVRAVAATLGAAVLAFAVMPTHVHVVAEGAADDLRERLARAIATYTRAFNVREGSRGLKLRGEIVAIPVRDEEQLVRALLYVHMNPVKGAIVERAVDSTWTSAREFAELSLAGVANVARVAGLIGARFGRIGCSAPPLADLEPRERPSAMAEEVLAAAAQAFGVAEDDLRSTRRELALVRARAAFVHLGRLESYRDSQLAALIDRTRGRMWQLGRAADGPALQGVRVARTLLRDPRLRAQLSAVEVASAGKEVVMV